MAEFKRLLPPVRAVAEEAGRIIMEIYSRDDFMVRLKEDESPLTDADWAAHECITRRLSELLPGVPVLSEESSRIPYDVRKEWSLFWLVDPLDGTKEFISRNGEFTVNIALIQRDVSVLGVVTAPALGVSYEAVACGRSVKVSGGEARPITVAPYNGGNRKIVASRSHGGDTLVPFLEAIGSYELVNAGSSLKFCMVAEGSAHLYPRLAPTMEWDTAAAQCILVAAGGAVVDCAGQPLGYNKPDLRNPYFIAHGRGDIGWRRALETTGWLFS